MYAWEPLPDAAEKTHCCEGLLSRFNVVIGSGGVSRCSRAAHGWGSCLALAGVADQGCEMIPVLGATGVVSQDRWYHIQILHHKHQKEAASFPCR